MEGSLDTLLGVDASLDERGSNIQALGGGTYPPQTLPDFLHRKQTGRVSSHLTFRALQVLQPVTVLECHALLRVDAAFLVMRFGDSVMAVQMHHRNCIVSQ